MLEESSSLGPNSKPSGEGEVAHFLFPPLTFFLTSPNYNIFTKVIYYIKKNFIFFQIHKKKISGFEICYWKMNSKFIIFISL